jgi:hypothetical protein
MASWRVSTTVERSSLIAEEEHEERAHLELVTRFGAGSSILKPFDAALERRSKGRPAPHRLRLGEMLVGEGLLTEDELAEALAEQRRSRPKVPLGEILLRRKLLPGAVLVRLLSKQCERELEEEMGFGTGLRRAIEARHRADRPESSDAPLGENRDRGSVVRAIRDEPRRGPRRLGELLMEEGVLTGEQLEAALAEQADSGRLLGEILLDHGYVPTITLVNVLAEQAHGAVERADGFGTGLRDAVEGRLLGQLSEVGAAVA